MKNEKYKLLMIGANKTLIYDFFVQMDSSFEMLSSSRRFDDIRAHLKYYQPDALIVCLYDETKDDIANMNRVKELLREVGAVLIVIGDNTMCDFFERTMPMASDFVIRREKNRNSKYIGEQIINYLKARAAYKKQKEQVEIEAAEENETAEPEVTESAPAAAASSSSSSSSSSIDDLLAAAAAAVNELQKMETKPKPGGNGMRHHVLVVDDDSSMLRMIKEILSDDYDVATAISGKVALKFLENRSTDVILLDYEMPFQSGAEVYERILDNPSTKNIPVVFLTGVSDRDRIADVLAMRPRGYLLKPIDSDRLKKTIKEIVG
jgi:CheY-like chemotaxis protein